MSLEQNKALTRRWLESFSAGNLAIMDELFAPNYLSHDPAVPDGGSLNGFKQLMGAMRAAFPDAQATIEDQVAEQDKVTTRFTVRATHQGELMGLPATHKPVTFSVIDITRIENGKFAESWFNQDTLGLLQQIGAIPTAR
jgi:steroid delta-isomerase-like uncharacterized protein